MIKPGMMNSHWTESAVAKQAIYLVVFHRVVETLYLRLLILILGLCRGFYEKGVISLNICP